MISTPSLQLKVAFSIITEKLVSMNSRPEPFKNEAASENHNFSTTEADQVAQLSRR